MPTTGEPTTGLLITALTVSLLLGAAAGGLSATSGGGW